MKNALTALGILMLGVIVSAVIVIRPTQADIYNPHPTPLSNSITTAMIQNSAVTAAKVSSTDSYTFGNTIATNATTTAATTTNLAITGNSISINGVTYSYPSSQGAASTNLQNDGSGNLTWVAAGIGAISASLPSATTTSDVTPEAVFMHTYKSSSISFDNASSNVGNGSSNFTITDSHTVNTNNHGGVFAVVSSMGSVNGTISATLDGSGMTTVGGDASTTVFFTPNVAAGSHSIVATITTSQSVFYDLFVASYNNIKQTQTGAVKNTVNATSQSLTTGTDGSWVGMVGYGSGGGSTVTALVNDVRRNITASQFAAYFDSNVSVSPAGAYTQSYTTTISLPSEFQFEIQPFAATFYGFDYTNANVAASTTPFIGFINAAPSLGVSQKVTFMGDLTGFSGLSPGSIYFLSNTQGSISTSAGANSRKVGTALSPTDLLIAQEP